MDDPGNGTGTCANIKAAGVTIYTVQVNTGGDPTSTLLQNCAGGPDKLIDPKKFYLLTTASAIFGGVQRNQHQPDPAARGQVATRNTGNSAPDPLRQPIVNDVV